MGLIETDELIEYIVNRYRTTCEAESYKDACCDILEKINSMPIIEPQRKKGKWKLMDDGYCAFFVCSQCGKVNNYKSNFCPNCGTNMKGEQDG